MSNGGWQLPASVLEVMMNHSRAEVMPGVIRNLPEASCIESDVVLE